MFIELMKKGKEDKMASEYSENMFRMRYCREKASCGRTSETTLDSLAARLQKVAKDVL